MCSISNEWLFTVIVDDILEGEEHIYELVRDLINGSVQDVIAWTSAQIVPLPAQAYEHIIECSKLMYRIKRSRYLKKRHFQSTNSDAFETDLINFAY